MRVVEPVLAWDWDLGLALAPAPALAMEASAAVKQDLGLLKGIDTDYQVPRCPRLQLRDVTSALANSKMVTKL